MALSKRLKKGGVSRYVIQGANNNDYFLLPRGFHIRYLAVENLANLPSMGTVSLGNKLGVYTTATFTVTGPFTSSSNAMTWGGGAFGTVTATAAVVTAATNATSAAYIASVSPVQTGPTLGATWILSANGANVTMISSAPGSFTAPTVTVGSSGLTVGSITTTLGSIDTTFMPATNLQQSFGAVTELTPFVNAAYKTNSSLFGTSLTTTFTNTTGAAGTYYLGGNQGMNSVSAYSPPLGSGSGSGTANVYTQLGAGGTPVAVPNNTTAIVTSYIVAGSSYYQYTILTSGTGTYFINGVSITGSATPSNLATNIATTVLIPGWMITAAGAVVTCYATGNYLQPTLTLGTAVTLTIGTVTWLPGYTIPGYNLAVTTPVTNTVTPTGVAGSAGKVAVTGIPITIPNTFTVAQSAQLISGCATYFFTIASATAGTVYLNGEIFTATASPTTTGTAIVALANVPGLSGDPGGWAISTGGTGIVCMQAQVPGIMQKPKFTAGAVIVPVLTPATDYFFQGIAFPVGYSSTFTGTTAVIVGPYPSFGVVDAPTTQTYASVITFAGSTGLMTIGVSQTSPGVPAPFLTGAIATQTYTQTTSLSDEAYYLNFSQEPNGLVNVYALLERLT